MEDQSPPGKSSDTYVPAPENPQLHGKRRGIVARLIHGTGAGTVAYGLGIVSNLLLLPLYLRFWSVARYGEWMALYSAVNYLANLDFGVTFAAVNAATIAYASDDWQTFKRVQGTAWTASLAIAGVGGVLVAALSLCNFFHLNRWLGLTQLGQREARLVFCGLAFSLLADIPGRQLIAVYIAIGEFAKYQWAWNGFSLLLCVATAVALIMGAGPESLAMVMVATTLLTIAIAFWMLQRKDPRLIPRLRDFDWMTARRLAAPTGQIGISMIASALTVQGPVVVLSRMLGGPAVALFTTTRTVTNMVRGTVILLRAPIRPELAAASAQLNRDALHRLFRLAVSIDTIAAITLSAVVWSGGEWFIRFWSHGRIHTDPMLLHLLLVVVVLEGFLQVLASPGWATNRIKALSVALLAAAVISIVLTALLVGRFGPSAVPIAAVIPLIVIITPVALKNACKEAHLSMRFITVRLLLPFFAIAIFSAIFPAVLTSTNLLPLWLSATLSLLAVGVVAVLITGTFSLTRDDRQSLRDRFSF
jgi:O-antigen/teichoic acid export membrane protein